MKTKLCTEIYIKEVFGKSKRTFTVRLSPLSPYRDSPTVATKCFQFSGSKKNLETNQLHDKDVKKY